MRYLPILLLGTLLCLSPAEARVHHARRATAHTAAEHSPAQGMVQTLNSMSAQLNSVHSKTAADAAAPQLMEQYKEFRSLQAAAEEQPPMTSAALERHLSSMDLAMNDFRMACARLIQEKFYGSATLGKAVKKMARDF